jgi:hypothetical protein
MVADIETDAVDYPSYFVYVAARSSDGNGDDVWFTRSTTQGASFSAGYRVASETAGTSQWYGYPLVGYGDDAYIHLSYTDGALSTDDGLLQRRTPSWADGGLAAWEAPITIDAVGNGVQVDNYAMEPSTTSGNVTVLVSVDYVDIKSRYSTDYGATWPGGNLADVVDGDVWDVRLLNLPSGDLTMIAGPTFTPGQPFSAFIHRSSVATPGTWGPAQAFSTHEWSGVGGQVGIAVDPTRGNRYAAAWLTYDGGIATVRFDAEWRRDPGYPNTEVGFPIAIAGGGQTPPAVAEVDYLDPELEIVFGTKDGNVHVVNHDGTVEAGWPVDIGTLPYDAPVAIGDLVGNGYNTVVSGNETGQVFAFDRNGDVLPGWPYDMGTGAPVFVSIGALGPPHKRYVVAVSGTEMVALNYWGENMAPEWEPVVVPFVRPSAIGDVEGDGSIAEVVSLRGQYLEIRRMGSPLPHLLLGVVGETFSDAPSLADIDGDGDLEIAAPTMSGKMYLFHHTGADYSPAWPITVSPGVRLTAAAVANILGTSEPEIVFAEGDGDVHIRFYTGVEQSGFPKVVGGPLFMPPMLSPVSITGSNVNIGTLASVGHSVRNISGIVTPGWPRNLPGQVEETFAGGDLDNDGRNEIVVLGLDFLTVFDVGIAPASDPKRHWPMYGYDAQRTSCLACVETLSDVDGTAPASASAALEIYPNPFNPATTITYEVARPGPVTLSIFDVHGRLIGTLLDGEHREPNRYSVSYQAQVASGVYFVRLVTAGEEVARKMVVLK